MPPAAVRSKQMKLIFAHRHLTILFISTFLFFTNEALFLPTLPLHLAESGYSNLGIGIILGAFALGVLVSRPLTGFITDRKGRKVSLVAGVVFFFISPVLYLVSVDFAYLIFVRFFHGLGIAFYTTAFPAYISDTADEERRGEAMGHMATSITLAFILGPLAGTTVYDQFGFAPLVWLCTLTGFVNLVVILMIAEIRIRTDSRERIPYRQAILKRGIVVSAGIQLMYGTIFGGIMTFLPLLLKAVDGVSIGLFFMVESVIVICCRIMAAHLADRYGRGPVFFYSFLTILAAVFIISNITTLALLVAAAVLFGMGSSLCAPALTAFVADNTEPATRGMVFGFVSCSFDTGVITAGIVLGAVADLVGFRSMFGITALSGCVALALFALLVRKGVGRSLAWTLVPRPQHRISAAGQD